MGKVDESIRVALGPADERLFIVGVSGGADSVALLAGMIKGGYRVVAAHCNFMLRGEESERDERHVADVCRRLGAELTTARFNTPEIMATRKGSVEMVCRELRYNWFDRLIRERHAAGVAIAHNADDNAETMMLNLLRGTGIAGLTAMRAATWQPVAVLRPLLDCSRREILEFLEDEGLEYVVDSSNLESVYRRNVLRNDIMPAIRRHFPNADKGIQTTIHHLQAAEDFIAERMAEIRERYVDADGMVSVEQIIAENNSARFILYEILSPAGFSATQIDDLIAAAVAQRSGRVFRAASGQYILDRGVVRGLQVATIRPMPTLEVTVVDAVEMDFSSEAVYFSPEVLEGEPLSLRFWREGDRFRPFGMKGSKLVSDLFTDMKIPSDRKQSIPLLVKGDSILWVVGIRRSSLFPVGRDSATAVRVAVSWPTGE